MKAFHSIPIPLAGFLALRTRQAVQLDIEDSPMQKIKKYRQKLMHAILCSRSLALRVGINFHLCYADEVKYIYNSEFKNQICDKRV